MFKEIVPAKFQRVFERPDRLRIAALSRTSKVIGRSFEVNTTLACGASMRIKMAEGISDGIAYEGDFEPDVTEMMQSVLKPGHNFFDIGAHYGLKTIQARYIMRDQGQVVAFEPAPEALRMLRTNCQRYENVTIVDAAVSSRSDDTLSLMLLPTRHEGSNTLGEIPRIPSEIFAELETSRIPVKTISIDDFVAKSGKAPDLMKIDVENHEMPVLLGARETIFRHRPGIIIETGDQGRTFENSTRACLDLLEEFGYDFTIWDGNRLSPMNGYALTEPGNVLATHRIGIRN